MDNARLVAALNHAADDLNAPPDVQSTLDAIVAVAAEQLPTHGHVGVSIAHRNGLIETVAATDDLVRDLDQVQYELGEGPCVHTIQSAALTVVPDLRHEQRWPRFVSQALDRGVTSHLAVRLFTNEHTLGGINFYSTTTSGVPDESVVVAELLATHAAWALGHKRVEQGLTTALESRRTIGIALGIVMERFGLDQHRAFDYLTRVSSQTNVKVRDVAAQLIEQTEGRLPGPAEAGTDGAGV